MKQWLLLIVVSFVLISCKEKQEVCQCDADQAYNAETGACDCMQPFPESERPALLANDYNSWSAVKKHFTYKVRYKCPETYPYFSHEGDTLLLCGWIDHTPLEKRVYSKDSSFVKISLLDDASSAVLKTSSNDDRYIACPVQLLEKIEVDKKVYVKGTLTFNRLNVGFFELDSPADSDKDCVVAYYAFRVLEIKN